VPIQNAQHIQPSCAAYPTKLRVLIHPAIRFVMKLLASISRVLYTEPRYTIVRLAFQNHNLWELDYALCPNCQSANSDCGR